MRGVTLPYRDCSYPLNVFMHVLTKESGHVEALHYGLFTLTRGIGNLGATASALRD